MGKSANVNNYLKLWVATHFLTNSTLSASEAFIITTLFSTLELPDDLLPFLPLLMAFFMAFAINCDLILSSSISTIMCFGSDPGLESPDLVGSEKKSKYRLQAFFCIFPVNQHTRRKF